MYSKNLTTTYCGQKDNKTCLLLAKFKGDRKMVKVYLTDSNLRYEHNEDTNEITCYVTDCVDEFYKSINRKCQSIHNGTMLEDVAMWIISKHTDKIIHDTYKGTVKCDPSDTFKLQNGFDMARSKALAKREEAYARMMIDINDRIKSMANQIFEVRDCTTLYNKHKTNAEAVAISGKSLNEIRGFA